MEEFYPIFMDCPLFEGISRAEFGGMLACLGAVPVRLGRGQLLWCEGEPARSVGILAAGALDIVRQDCFGSRSIVARIAPGGVFGESFACAGVEALPVSVEAAQDSVVILLDCRRIVSTCSTACAFHSRVVSNLLRLVALKNLELNRKLEILSRRSTREKLMAYLLSQAPKQGGSFTIPYDRQELADYLGVDRSGLSAEIGKLRREGVLECEKNRFRLAAGNARG